MRLHKEFLDGIYSLAILKLSSTKHQMTQSRFYIKSYDKRIANQCKIHMYNRDIYTAVMMGRGRKRRSKGSLAISRTCIYAI